MKNFADSVTIEDMSFLCTWCACVIEVATITKDPNHPYLVFEVQQLKNSIMDIATEFP